MRYRSLRVGLTRTVNLGNYESARFELALDVDLADEGVDREHPGLDPSDLEEVDRFRLLCKTAYEEVAREIVRERVRLLKTPDNVVSIEERLAGAATRPGSPHANGHPRVPDGKPVMD